MPGVITTSFQSSVTVQGKSYSAIVAVTSAEALQVGVVCTASQAGSLTTRTNNTDGSITMTSNSHLITTGMEVDLYWSGGQRRAVTVGSVSGTTVPVSGAANGDNLPVANTAIYVAPIATANFSMVGADCVGITGGFNGQVEGTISLIANTTEVMSGLIDSADYIWFDGSGVTNPVTGNTITKLKASVNNNANTQFKSSLLYN